MQIKQYLAEQKTSWRKWLGWASLFGFCYVVGLFLPQGFDWVIFFSKGAVSPVWTPWTPVILKFLNWPLVVAITLFAIIYRAFRYNRSPWPIALAVLSLPTMWVLYLGNLDGLVLAGLLLLPWGVPLAAMKPQLAAFACEKEFHRCGGGLGVDFTGNLGIVAAQLHEYINTGLAGGMGARYIFVPLGHLHRFALVVAVSRR